MTMKLGMVGLGKMGANMSTRLLQGGHRVVVYDRNPPKVKALAEEGESSFETSIICSRLPSPREDWDAIHHAKRNTISFARASRATVAF